MIRDPPASVGRKFEFPLVKLFCFAPILCFQVETEEYMAEFFRHAQLAADHAHRKIVKPKDIEFVKKIRSREEDRLVFEFHGFFGF